MNAIQQRLSILQENIGKTLSEIASLCPNEERDKELYIPQTKKKGGTGRWLEWFITDIKPDNKAEADSSLFEIKSITVRISRGKVTPFENQRLSIINYNTIQTTSFEDSCILKKSNMLVALVSKTSSKMGHDKVFYGLGTINLDSVIEQAKKDYAYIRQMCMEGRAHELTSRKDQPGVYLKTYSSGNGKNIKKYKTLDGVEHECKGKAIYLFKKEWMELFTPINMNSISFETTEQENIIKELLTF